MAVPTTITPELRQLFASEDFLTTEFKPPPMWCPPKRSEQILFMMGARYWPWPPRMERFELYGVPKPADTRRLPF